MAEVFDRDVWLSVHVCSDRLHLLSVDITIGSFRMFLLSHQVLQVFRLLPVYLHSNIDHTRMSILLESL